MNEKYLSYIMSLGVVVIVIICSYVILSVFDRPYFEDVSSCFPYNIAPWFALIPVISVPICIIIFLWLNKFMGEKNVK
jgi:hypothetical protein